MSFRLLLSTALLAASMAQAVMPQATSVTAERLVCKYLRQVTTTSRQCV